MGLYRITDNYIYFWFRFVYPYRAYIERNETDWVLDKIMTSIKTNHISFVYEDICRERVFSDQRDNLKLLRIGKWWYKKDGEIEIVGIGEDKDILFGECKYSVNPKGMDVLIKLMDQSQKVQWNNKDRKNHYAIFSHSGFDVDLEKYAEEHENVFLYKI